MATGASILEEKLPGRAGRSAKIGISVLGVALIIGFINAGMGLASDLPDIHSTEVMPLVLLGIALLGEAPVPNSRKSSIREVR